MTRVCAGPDCGIEFTPSVHNQKFHNLQCKRDAENNARRRQFTRDLAEAVAPAYLDDDNEALIDFLRKENTRLARAADKYKLVRDETVVAVEKAIVEAVSKIEIPKIDPPEKDGRKNDEEVAVAILADWQLGKKTPTYNSDVCRARIRKYGEKLIRITNIQRADHPVRKLHVWILGDIVEGEDIFSGQSHLIDSSLYRQVGVNGPEIFAEFFNMMLQEFEEIQVSAVIGNHGSIGGRTRKDYNSETNMDRLLYKIVELMYRNEPRITFNIPDGNGESNFYAVDTIGDYGTLLMHGDQFPPPSSNHTYYKKVMGWKDGAIEEKFNDVFVGHYHQNAKMTLGTSILRISGSPESYNTYAQETLAVMGRPSQHFQFVHPQHGVTGEYTIYLDT